MEKLTKQKWLDIKNTLTGALEYSAIIYNYDIDEELLNEICNDINFPEKAWETVCVSKSLSNNFIRENLKHIKWSMIVENEKIDIKNLIEFKNNINYLNVLEFQNFIMDVVHASDGLEDLYNNNEKIVDRFNDFIMMYNEYIDWKNLDKSKFCNRFLLSYRMFF